MFAKKENQSNCSSHNEKDEGRKNLKQTMILPENRTKNKISKQKFFKQ